MLLYAHLMKLSPMTGIALPPYPLSLTLLCSTFSVFVIWLNTCVGITFNSAPVSSFDSYIFVIHFHHQRCFLFLHIITSCHTINLLFLLLIHLFFFISYLLHCTLHFGFHCFLCNFFCYSFSDIVFSRLIISNYSCIATIFPVILFPTFYACLTERWTLLWQVLLSTVFAFPLVVCCWCCCSSCVLHFVSVVIIFSSISSYSIHINFLFYNLHLIIDCFICSVHIYCLFECQICSFS